MGTDLVCGMGLEKNAGATFYYEGHTYYFCGTGCRDKFSEFPEKFLKKLMSLSRRNKERPFRHYPIRRIRSFCPKNAVMTLFTLVL